MQFARTSRNITSSASFAIFLEYGRRHLLSVRLNTLFRTLEFGLSVSKQYRESLRSIAKREGKILAFNFWSLDLNRKLNRTQKTQKTYDLPRLLLLLLLFTNTNYLPFQNLLLYITNAFYGLIISMTRFWIL
jgi:hypothetical protein